MIHHAPGFSCQKIDTILSEWCVPLIHEMDEKKRDLLMYRSGINLLNRGPAERGFDFLINRGFIKRKRSQGLKADIAHFILSRSGLSKKVITEYLFNPDKEFNQQVLRQFVMQQEYKGKSIDESLRSLLSLLKLPHDANTSYFLRCFAERYVACNDDSVTENGGKGSSLTSDATVNQTKAGNLIRMPSTASSSSSSSHGNVYLVRTTQPHTIPALTENQAFLTAQAILILNKNWHVPSFQRQTRMSKSDFLSTLVEQLGVDFKHDDHLLLMYESIIATPIASGEDHVDKVKMKQNSLKPNAQNKIATVFTDQNLDRRFVMQPPVRMHDGGRWNPRDRPDFEYNKELMIFNDAVVVVENMPGQSLTSATRALRCHSMIMLLGVDVRSVSNPNSKTISFGIQVVREEDNHVLLLVSLRTEKDRDQILEALKDVIIETKMTDAASRM